MKIIKLLFFATLMLSLSFGCKMKNTCELNHTGEIAVTNKTGDVLDVYIDNLKVFLLDNLATKTIDKPVGEYKVKCLKYPNEWEQTVIIIECETVSVQFPGSEE